jgi:tetratricopeptide (TPR) repeat protein
MKTEPRQWRGLVLLLGLLLAGIGTIIVGCSTPGSPAAPPFEGSPLPTRAPTTTPVPVNAILERMRPALLGAQPEKAIPIWEEAKAYAPDHPAVEREGARLALALGNLEMAEQRAWDAVIANPDDVLAWALLGAIQQRLGNRAIAQQAFSYVETLSPTLAAEVFPAQWRAAVESDDGDRLTRLAQTYIARHPKDPLTIYYRAEALLVSGHHHAALDLLLLSVGKDAPAVLWYTLGRAYLQMGAEEEAAITLEAALRAHSRGDTTLQVATNDPLHDLYRALGRAYVGSGQCEEALRHLSLLVTPYPDLQPLLERAQNCPVPTPTVTPWLPEDWADSP